jgi:hypothetical protein
MTDLETRLRDLLVAAAPDSPATDGLAAGARRYAARARRARTVTAVGVLVAVLAVGGAVASGAFHERTLAPARPRPAPAELCPDLQRDLSSLGTLPGKESLDAVKVCAFVDEGSAWPGSLPPDEDVEQPGALSLLSMVPATVGNPSSCGDVPRGRAFTVSTLDLRGVVRTFPNTDLACDGWPFLATYYVALSELGADWVAAQGPPDPYPTCPSMLHEPDRAALGAAAELPRGTVLTSASVCAHPTAAPVVVGDASTPEPVFVRRGVVAERDLAALNADLARTPASRGGRQCGDTAQRLHVTYVIRGVTQDGGQVTLTAADGCLPIFLVDGDRTLTISLSPNTVASLVGDRLQYP